MKMLNVSSFLTNSKIQPSRHKMGHALVKFDNNFLDIWQRSEPPISQWRAALHENQDH